MMAGSSFRDYPRKVGYETGTGNLVKEFYVPALSRAVEYDRKAGYFNSSALAVAAKGIARFLQNDGTMRLLVNCRLSELDTKAINDEIDLKQQVEERLLADWNEPEDAIQRDRLKVLADMVATGRLTVKVVVLVNQKGQPIVANDDHATFSWKMGILKDAQGD